MKDRFQGDPKLYLSLNGASLKFVSGQPIMDPGLENLVNISLFTKKGWCLNSLTDKNDEKIGSDFEETSRGPITLSKLNDIKQSAERALKNPAFGKITTEVVNPESYSLDVVNKIEPPGNDIQELRVSRNGQNWQNQALKGRG